MPFNNAPFFSQKLCIPVIWQNKQNDPGNVVVVGVVIIEFFLLS